jgi:D-alanyl-D-alanine dipeptidase
MRKSNTELNPNKPANISESTSPPDIDVPVTSEEPNTSENLTVYLQKGGTFELPLSGASGYANAPLSFREGPSLYTNAISRLKAGQGFTILGELHDWWQIELGGKIGWVMSKHCLINLPDVIPSIIYNNTNAYSSILVSSGKEITNITGQQLYKTYVYNKRFDEEGYLLPVSYVTALKIGAAQRAALAEGNTLIIYEAFRPYKVQQKIVENLKTLANADAEVRNGIIKPPWSMGWFIATGTSNHQRGYAIDVSLGKVISREKRQIGSYVYNGVNEYKEYSMPTKIHELSIRSITFNYPVSFRSDTEWREASPSDTMNNEALLLQKYCTKSGLAPIASEWWHFNDMAGIKAAKKNVKSGRFFIEKNYSVIPISMESSN